MDTTEAKNDKVENEITTPQDTTTAKEAAKEETKATEVEKTTISNDSKVEEIIETTEETTTKKTESSEEETKATEEEEIKVDKPEVIEETTTEEDSKVEEKPKVKEDITIEEAENTEEEIKVDKPEVNEEATTEEGSNVEEETETIEETTVEEPKNSTEETSIETSKAKEHINDKSAVEGNKETKEVDYENLSMEELAAALTELVGTDNIESVKRDVGSIKSNFIKKIKQIKQDHYDKHISNGGTDDDYKTIKFDYEEVYRSAYNIYKEKRRIYVAQMEQMKVENLKKKNDLLENLRNMINSDENLNTVYKEFQKLQEEWREIGLVAQTEVKNLWENYHFLVEKFFDKVRINKELMMIGLNKNLEQKIILCEKAEELLLEKSINKSFLTLQEYHTKWKEVGPVPNEKNDEIWERFKNASDKVNERRQEHYEEMHKEQLQNLELKTFLCEKIEAMVEVLPDDIKNWNNVTDSINEIFANWKKLGPTPKKQNDEIWIRFKKSMNLFFNEKKAFFGSLKDEQMNNYQLKQNLVEQANTIKNSDDWKNATQSLINLQKKWKTIGPTPRKYSNDIWKEFRAACDHFFNTKDEFFKNINASEKENKALKLELIKKFENQEFTDDSKASLEIIKNYQRDWINVGRVPIKDKNSLQAKFQEVVEKHLSNLNIDRFEFQNATFKTKLDGAENPKDAEQMIQKEINFIKGKVDTIVKDVTLWENNMTFFNNSKNADLLKADFEKKIVKAKNDIKSFKAKLRQFDKMKRNL